jgi:predicted lipoprotein with Yx(FWY)xxD motif
MENKSQRFNGKRSLLWFSIVMTLGLVLAACSPAATPTLAPAATSAPATAPATAVATTAPVPVTSGEAALSVVSDAKLGSILAGNNGMTVYAFTKDGPNQSNCTGQCLTNWPPLKTQGSPQLGSGVDASLVGNIALADGSKVVTYNKMPLYYFFKDTKAGEVNGQGVGSVWFTLSPDGKLVGQSSTAPAASSTDEAPAATEATINVTTDPKLGKILVDGKGMTMYMFTKDTPDKSNCAGGCLKAWPALITLGSPKTGDGVNASMIGSAALPDGSKIVTYNHMPLYYFVQDKAAGDTKGQGNGSVWFVVGPDGKPVGMDTQSATPAGSTAPAAAEAAISVATDAKLGKILVGANGMTLYMFAKDNPDKSNCSAGCLKAWPPLLTQGSPKLGNGVNPALVGSTALPDGTKIVTYNHMPLYYYAKDTKAGDVTGQGVGSVWFVVSPDGKAVGQ